MLELNNISLKFGKRVVLSGLNCGFSKGINFLCGVNGSGKTSLLNIISGQIEEYSGEVLLDSKKIDLDKIAYCRQFMADAFFTNSVIDEIDYTIEYSDSKRSAAEIWQWLDLLGIKKEIIGDKSPFLLNLTEQKLLSFVLAIIKEYDILLLDETDSGLPFGYKKLLADFLKRFNDKILIVISHDLWFINYLSAQVINLKIDGEYAVYNDSMVYLKTLELPESRLKLILEKDVLLDRLRNE